jgi:T3SS negative regulator,GrlR
MIQPGIYQLHFSGGPSHNTGDGIGVVKEGAINGGDPGYIYRGSYDVKDDGHVTAKINVKRWNPAISNPIANLSEYDLIVEGHAPTDGARFSVEGHVQQHPNIRIKIDGKRLEAAI